MINNLAFYDQNILPKLLLPATIKQEESTKYLGNRYLENDITLSVSYFAEDAQQIQMLYNFWKNDCLAGTKPFILQANIFGINQENENFLAFKFLGAFEALRSEGISREGSFTLLLKYKVNTNNELEEIN